MMTVTSSSAIAALSPQKAATDNSNNLHLPIRTLLSKSAENEPFSFTWTPIF